MGIALTGPIALLFPGQGVQKPGMGKNLYDRYPAARRVYERAEVVLEMPVRKLCFEGPVEELNRTDVIQPCVMTVCWAAYEVWRESYGLENVSVTAGHSLGEIASLAAAGSIPWETALLLGNGRRRLPKGRRQASSQSAVDSDPRERVWRGSPYRDRAAGGASPADAAPGGLGADDGLDAGDEGAHGRGARSGSRARKPRGKAHPGRGYMERGRAVHRLRRSNHGLSGRPRWQDRARHGRR